MKKLYPLQFAESADECVIDDGKKSEEKLALEEKKIKFSSSCTEDSFIAKGFLAGNTLDEVIETYLGNLLGDNIFEYYRGVFPLQVKIHRFNKMSPILVSPDNTVASERFGCWGKERFWYVADVKPGAQIFMGFKKEMTARSFFDYASKHQLKDVMNEIEPEVGESFYIAPGVPFCAGGGVTIIEVAQNSPVELDLTDDGQIGEAMDFINYHFYTPEYKMPEECSFRVEKVMLKSEEIISPEDSDSFIVYVGLSGNAKITAEKGYAIGQSDIILIPQELNEFHFTPDSENPTFLRIYMAPVKEEKDAYLNYEEHKEHHHQHDQHDNCAHHDHCDHNDHHDHCDDDECECHHHDS